jgi:hypothetical protein
MLRPLVSQGARTIAEIGPLVSRRRMGVSRNPRRFKGGNAPDAALFHIAFKQTRREKFGIKSLAMGFAFCRSNDSTQADIALMRR